MNGGDLQQREAAVKAELAKFIRQHTGQDTLSSIDDIVLSYVVSILETLGSGDEDAFDVDQFSEMMAAYLPSFININSGAVCEWMFSLAKHLSEQDSTLNSGSINSTEKATTTLHSNKISLNSPDGVAPFFQTMPPKVEGKSVSSDEECSVRSRNKSTSSQSEDEDRLFHHISSLQHTNAMDVHEQLMLLTEMFPRVSIGEIQQCLTIAHGDCDRAAQMLLHREEQGDANVTQLRPIRGMKLSLKTNTEDVLQDKEFRATILQRYGYIDQDEDVREHRPVAPKVEPKKLIRYRDNKIVSVKGERYTEVKTEDSEESLKKTYVTIKPARQYRFH